jgi:trimethylamine--corrinoid protein Co-methyltransferase
MAALAGVNMVSRADMLDFESCQSFEKLVIDAEIIGMAKRLIAGVEVRDEPIALELMRKMGHRGDYLGQLHTLQWFREEQYIPSEIIDRGSLEAWKKKGRKTAWERARARVTALLDTCESSPVSDGLRSELRAITLAAAQTFGMDELPPLPED